MRWLALCLVLVACGGGGSGDPPKITVEPATATLYSGLPTTFHISGGTPPYVASSSNQSALPFDGSTGAQLVLLANPVATDTTLTLTVRDSAGTPPATATLTVKPNVVSSNIAIVPAPGCEPAVCSGSVASITATLSEGSIPLPSRPIQFSVESGSFSIDNADATTDAAGSATAHLSVAAGVPSQPARLRVTDVPSGLFATIVFQISRPAVSGPSLFVTPESLAFSGSNGNCASGQSARVAVIGGTPPYQILPLSGFVVSPSGLGASGQQFSVATNGTCASGSVTVIDSDGTSASVSVVNVPGPPAPTPIPSLTVQPVAAELATCDNTATIAFAGGTGTYSVFSSNSAVVVSASGNKATLSLLTPSAAYPPTVDVIVQSGEASRTVAVKIDPLSCP